MIKVVFKDSKGEDWSGARDKDGNIFMRAESWSDIVKGVAVFRDGCDKDAKPEAILAEMIKHFERRFLAEGRSLPLPEGTVEDRAFALFRALQLRDVVAFSYEGGSYGKA